MALATMMINGTSVHLSEPYEASFTGDFLGRTNEIQSIINDWRRVAPAKRMPYHVLLVGPPGVGKNWLAYEASRICGKKLYMTLAHKGLQPWDLMTKVIESEKPGKKFDYILSPLATAMCLGAVFFLDEICKLSDEALAPLLGVLDDRSYLDPDFLGGRIHAHPGFRFIAATTPGDLARNPLVLADGLKRRFRITKVGYPEREEVDRFLQKRFPFVLKNESDLLGHFWDLWRKSMKDTPPTLDDCNRIFGDAIGRADDEENGGGRPLTLEREELPVSVGRKHLEKAFERFLSEFRT
jgi:hypothetical protein